MNFTPSHSHNMKVILKNAPSKEIEEQILEEIIDMIHGKPFVYSIDEFLVKIQWDKAYPHLVYGYYSTDVKGFYGDIAVKKHKERLLEEVKALLKPKWGDLELEFQQVTVGIFY